MTYGAGVRYCLTDSVAQIRLDAPKRLNALSPAMMGELIVALERAESEARAVLLSGEGAGFCSGVDLSSVGAEPTPDLDGGAILEEHVNPMMQAMRNLKLPVVCALHGVAAGLGMALALSSDMIVAGRSSYLFAPFARIGLLPDGGIPYLLHQAVGRVRAARILMLAEKVPAEKALEWGLVTHLVEDEQVFDTAASLAAQLAGGPTIALGGIRRLAWSAGEGAFSDALGLEREMQKTIPATEDCREGHNAFLEKRRPVFLGR